MAMLFKNSFQMLLLKEGLETKLTNPHFLPIKGESFNPPFFLGDQNMYGISPTSEKSWHIYNGGPTSQIMMGPSFNKWWAGKETLITSHTFDCLIGVPLMDHNNPYQMG